MGDGAVDPRSERTALADRAARLFADVMAPLVLGGALRPGRVISPRTALALAEPGAAHVDPDLFRRVQRARVGSARLLAPIDEVQTPTAEEWLLAAALNNLLQAVNPNLSVPLRARTAARILDLAQATLDEVRPPANVSESLSRHTWMGRVLETTRTDTVVSWWIGSRTFLGVEPPRRFQAWPKLRRVQVASTSRKLLELGPLAFDRQRLVSAVSNLLARTPLTDIASCTRSDPPFQWSDAALSLVSARAGRTLASRALARLPAADVVSTLVRAGQVALAQERPLVRAALSVLAERALADRERSES